MKHRGKDKRPVCASTRVRRLQQIVLGLLALCAVRTASAEEIMGTDPASPGRFQLEQRFGYVTTFNPPQMQGGRRVPQRAMTGETELGYSPVEWYEIALTSPYAIARTNTPMVGGAMDNGAQPYALQSGGFTIRQTFIQGDRLERPVFFGLVARTIFAPANGLTPEFFVPNRMAGGNPQAPRFVQEANPRISGMLTPIIGFNLPNDYQIILTANLGFGIVGAGSAFEPSVRVVKRLSDRWTVGIEHFANLGPIGTVLPWHQQMQTLYAVANTRMWGLEFGFGVGYGLTNASRGLALKANIGKDF